MSLTSSGLSGGLGTGLLRLGSGWLGGRLCSGLSSGLLGLGSSGLWRGRNNRKGASM
jgi:hypothetical protein